MDGNLPHLSSWSPENDPMGLGFQNAWHISPPSMPSIPSAPSSASAASDKLCREDIWTLMFPVDAYAKAETVFGVYTPGSYTQNKKYLPIIYNLLGEPFCCHSCGVPLAGEFIGDHQMPSILREKSIYFDPHKPGKFNKIFKRMLEPPPLLLYEFNVTFLDPYSGKPKNMNFQTNNVDRLWRFGIQPTSKKIYLESLEKQYLYPHCRACSDRQGRILW